MKNCIPTLLLSLSAIASAPAMAATTSPGLSAEGIVTPPEAPKNHGGEEVPLGNAFAPGTYVQLSFAKRLDRIVIGDAVYGGSGGKRTVSFRIPASGVSRITVYTHGDRVTGLAFYDGDSNLIGEGIGYKTEPSVHTIGGPGRIVDDVTLYVGSEIDAFYAGTSEHPRVAEARAAEEKRRREEIARQEAQREREKLEAERKRRLEEEQARKTREAELRRATARREAQQKREREEAARMRKLAEEKEKRKVEAQRKKLQESVESLEKETKANAKAIATRDARIGGLEKALKAETNKSAELLKLVNELRQENAGLRAENAKLKERISNLEKQVTALNKQVEALNKKIDQLQSTIEELIRELEWFKRNIGSSR